MTRVLTIEPAGNLWGSERALLDAIDGMDTTEVAVCCPPGRPIIAELDRRFIRVLPFFVYALHEKGRWARLWAAIGVIRACLEFRPDVIHLNQTGCYRVVLLAAVLFNVPIVAHVRIFEDAYYLAAVRPSPRRLRSVIAISAAIAEELRTYPQLSEIEIRLLYDAYIGRTTSERVHEGQRMSKRIGCIGRIVPAKGQDLLIAALHRLWQNGFTGIECLIVGAGSAEYVQELKDMAGEGPAAGGIQWLGNRSDVVPLLRTCAAMACPSRREPLGRVIFEAWDAGAIPVACAKSAGAAEIIVAAKAGVLYDDETPQSLARGLQRALRLSQKESAVLIRNGREWMSKNCDAKRYGDAFAAVLAQSHRAS